MSQDNSNILHTDHNGVTTIHASLGNPGHAYVIEHHDNEKEDGFSLPISFQEGPVKEHGVNGATSEGLLAVLIHRTGVLNGNFPCEENELAILHLKKALEAFESRTRNRQARGVEGENKI